MDQSARQRTYSENFTVTVDAYGDKGVRRQMEDEHLICLSLYSCYPGLPEFTKNMSIFGIFDGHGGRSAATYIKENLTQEIGKQLIAYYNPETVENAQNEPIDSLVAGTSERPSDPFEDDLWTQYILTKTFTKLDSSIVLEIPSCKDGSTAIVMIIKGIRVITANLGDSAAYLARTMKGELHAIPLNELHKPWVIKEKERILASGGTIEGGRINGALEITRSFGDIAFKRYGILCTPSFQKFTLDPQKDKFIVLGCDGLWACWSAKEAITKISSFIQTEIRRIKTSISANDKHAKLDVKSIARLTVEHTIIEKKSQVTLLPAIGILETMCTPLYK